jgi:hypothetical protein
LTYALFNAENLLRLAQPMALGLAVADLARASARGLAWYAALHLAYLLIGAARQAFDTRTFTTIHADLATRVVVAQRREGIEVSRVAARSALSRELVDFFEHDLAVVFSAVYSVLGALVVLGLYDRLLVVLCLVLALPATIAGRLSGRKALTLHGRLNDELEREVAVIDEGEPRRVGNHYRRVARWRVGLSDVQAVHFGVTQLGILILLTVALTRSSHASDAGRIIAVSRYILMFALGLDSLPPLIPQLTRLHDIGRRIHNATMIR